MNTVKFVIEGLLTILVTIVFALVSGLLIWFLWPVIVTVIPGLEGIVATNITYIDGAGISLLLSVLVSSFRQ